jgi:hypothetical protein
VDASPWWAPAWLRRTIGDEYFQEVTRVWFDGETKDDQLAPVEHLDRLLEFELGGFIYGEKTVTDAGIAHLRRLKSLRMVKISNAKITDAGLAHLAGLPHLQPRETPFQGWSYRVKDGRS